MKTIVKLSLMIVLAGSLATYTAKAQPGHGMKGHKHGPGYGHRFGPDSCHLQLMVEDLSDILSLSDKQKADILELHYAHMEEMKSISEKYRNDCVGEREARIESRKKMDEEIKKILTEEQQEKFEKLINERRGPHEHHHGHWK